MEHHVAIVGTGRLGASLFALLSGVGVYTTLHGREGAHPDATIVVLAVPDAAIAAAAAALPVGRIVLHCSGASSVDVLRPHRPAGSFHPLMTFPGVDRLPDLRGVPAAIAGDPEALAAARHLAAALGMWPVEVPGDRALYHASAVMAGNFATVLLAEAARVLSAAGVSPADARRMLLPLAVQSLKNAVDDPARALTGPVARGDDVTIATHRDALRRAGLLDEADLYDRLTERARRLLKPQVRSDD